MNVDASYGPDDPFELLKRLNPVPDPEQITAQQQDRLDQILAGIVASDAGRSGLVVLPSPRQRRRRRMVAVTIAVVVTATAAFAWAVTRHPSDPLSISCFAESSLGSDRTQVAADGRDYRDVCAQAWSEGKVVASVSEVPSLVACVLDGGSVAVFPDGASAVCGRLGLAEVSPEKTPADGQPTKGALLARLQQELIETFLNEGCVSPSRGDELVDAALARHHLNGWRVQRPPAFPSDRPCASLAFDPPGQTIVLVPVPQPPQRRP